MLYRYLYLNILLQPRYRFFRVRDRSVTVVVPSNVFPVPIPSLGVIKRPTSVHLKRYIGYTLKGALGSLRTLEALEWILDARDGDSVRKTETG